MVDFLMFFMRAIEINMEVKFFFRKFFYVRLNWSGIWFCSYSFMYQALYSNCDNYDNRRFYNNTKHNKWKITFEMLKMKDIKKFGVIELATFCLATWNWVRSLKLIVLATVALVNKRRLCLLKIQYKYNYKISVIQNLLSLSFTSLHLSLLPMR